jgi:hypothetical protein
MKIVEPGFIMISSGGITFAEFIFDMTDEEASLSDEELEILAIPLCIEWARKILHKQIQNPQVERVISRGHFTPAKGDLH